MMNKSVLTVAGVLPHGSRVGWSLSGGRKKKQRLVPDLGVSSFTKEDLLLSPPASVSAPFILIT